MNSLERLLKYHLRSFVAAEIMLLLLYFMFVRFVNPLLTRYDNTISFCKENDIDEIFLVQGNQNQTFLSHQLFLANGNISLKVNDSFYKCNIVLINGGERLAYIDEHFYNNVKGKTVKVIYDDMTVEVEARPIISLYWPFFKNNYPTVLLAGFDDFIARYNLLSIECKLSDLSDCMIVDYTTSSDICIKFVGLFALWDLAHLLLIYCVRRFTPIYGKASIIGLYNYLYILGVSRKVVIRDCIVFEMLVNSVWFLVFIYCSSFIEKSIILPSFLFQMVIAPMINETLIIYEGFRR